MLKQIEKEEKQNKDIEKAEDKKEEVHLCPICKRPMLKGQRICDVCDISFNFD